MKNSRAVPILFIESGAYGGGSFESLYQHMKVLDRSRFRPIIVCLNPSKYLKLWQALGIEVHLIHDNFYSLSSKSFFTPLLKLLYATFIRSSSYLFLGYLSLLHLSLMKEIIKIISREGIELLVLNDQIFRDLFGVLIAKRCGVKCVSHLRSMRSKGFNRSLACFGNRRVDLFIANSQNCKEHWCKLGLDRKKIVVIYNAVNDVSVMPRRKQDICDEFSISERFDHILGCVANFDKAKGHRFLLQSFRKLCEKHKNYFLLLVGHGPLLQETKEYVAKRGLSGAVKFVGYQNQAHDIIAALDALIVPSRSEAFGRTILEAMQVRTAVIATDVGGIPEVITNNFNGLLVMHGDVAGMVHAILRLTNQPELQERLIKNAFETVGENFSGERYANEIERIYADILSLDLASAAIPVLAE